MSWVTICIPVRNDDTYLTEALYSIQFQTIRPLEVIVVDDGSEPEIGFAIKATAAAFGAHYVKVAHRGIPGARNTGLMLANGTGFVPLDADDALEPDFLDRTTRALQEADVVAVGVRDHDGVHPARALSHDSSPYAYCALYRARTLKRVGGWNGLQHPHYEDWDLWLDLMARGARIKEIDEPLFYHRVRPGTVSTSRDPVVAGRNYEEMLGRVRDYRP